MSLKCICENNNLNLEEKRSELRKLMKFKKIMLKEMLNLNQIYLDCDFINLYHEYTDIIKKYESLKK